MITPCPNTLESVAEVLVKTDFLCSQGYGFFENGFVLFSRKMERWWALTDESCGVGSAGSRGHLWRGKASRVPVPHTPHFGNH